MKKYSVTLPFAGGLEVYVTAEDEESALQEAWSNADITVTTASSDCEVLEVEVYHKLASGNVLYAPYHEAEVEEVEDDDR